MTPAPDDLRAAYANHVVVGRGPNVSEVERVMLVAQLVWYLRYSMTATGLKLWFENPADQLGQRSPLELIDDDVASAWKPLVAYARGGRGQLAG